MINSLILIDLRNFFSTEERPVKFGEFWIFWNSLSIEEQSYYVNAL